MILGPPTFLHKRRLERDSFTPLVMSGLCLPNAKHKVLKLAAAA